MFVGRGAYMFYHIIRRNIHLSPRFIQKHNPVLEKLSAEFDDVSYIAETVNNEDVREISFNEWKSRIKLLKNYGFEDSDCFQMISKYPSLLKIPEIDLESSVKQWLHAQLGTRNFKLVLINHPHLLEVDEHVIRKRIPLLKTYFRTYGGLSELIINCPNIMYENWNVVTSKLDYLIKEKNYKIGDILQSCALSKDLNFMKLRFYVAEKCGVYKQLNLKPHKEDKKNKNPKLVFIIQNKDENFARLVANITLEEYIAAKDLFTYENNTDYSDSNIDKDDNDWE